LNLGESNALVTGGAGFIGSHLTEALLSRGANVTVYDTFDSFYEGKQKNLAETSRSKKFRLINGNILDVDTLDAAMKGVSLVFHEAGQAGVGFSVANPEKSNQVNVNGTLNVLTLARKNGVKRVINVSSSSVFGEPRYLPIDESHPANPTSPYGVSKLAAEHYARVFSRVYGIYTISLRYFSVYGPRGRPDQVIHRFAASLLRGEPPVIQGDGSHSRDFTYVSDIVSGTIAAGESEDLSGEVFNLGFGNRTSVAELAEKMIRLTGQESRITPRYVEESKSDFPHTQADNGKARRLLGWNPNVGLDEGLRLFVAWLKNNPVMVASERL
jgi:UDP-glucose 4-epimerase